VDWYFQASAAERALRNLTGVRGVSNFIRVMETPAPSDVRQGIKEALKRQAEADAGEIIVETRGHTVTLRGTVRTIIEKRDAEYAAWRARGVTRVENQITINAFAPVMA
jgi:osmotically-inducible protein OsmY